MVYFQFILLIFAVGLISNCDGFHSHHNSHTIRPHTLRHIGDLTLIIIDGDDDDDKLDDETLQTDINSTLLPVPNKITTRSQKCLQWLLIIKWKR